jgi:predicted ester cyclase
MTERSLRKSYQAIVSAVAAADLDALDRLIDVDITDHDAVPGQVAGRDGVKYWVTMMHDAFADLTGVVEDTVLEGDKIAARVTWHGIHRGDFVGLSGTGVAVTMQSVQILKFTDGLASDWWGTADVFGVLRQVGAQVAKPAY